MPVVLSCEPLRVWSRLEPRSRQPDFGRNLAAEIYDPLWMLARQWQFGEFKGEDTGSPIIAKLATRNAKIEELRPKGGTFSPFGTTVPLEARVERQIPGANIETRSRLGNRWLKTLDAAGKAFNAAGGTPAYDPVAYRTRFTAQFPISLPALSGSSPGDQAARARAASNPRAQRYLKALVGRAVDGAALLTTIPEGPLTWAALPASISGGVPVQHQSFVLGAVTTFRDRSLALFGEPDAGDDAWSAEQLEYRFDCRVPRPGGQQLVLTADAYDGDRLDWYSFEIGDATGVAGGNTDVISEKTFSVIPTRAEFAGQPNPRWWQLEDGSVDLGNVRADTTDLSRIIVSEFALVYGNNWFVIPCRQEVGTLAEILGIVVADVFGQRTLVTSANRGDDTTWTRWDFFSLGRARTATGLNPLGAHLLIAPALADSLESEPRELVQFVRDEMTNTAWAIEARVPDGLGGGRDGTEAARRFSAALAPPAGESGNIAGLRYILANSVPENWIPFIPVHQPRDDRAIRLQRASMPRFLANTVRPVRPLTSILRPGLTENEQQVEPYFVHEEEVTRAGIKVAAYFQRARWYDGAIATWYGRRKSPGRGEGGSGLRFDILEDSSIPRT
jgi:hypothetical protein